MNEPAATFRHTAADGTSVYCRRWTAVHGSARGVVQIAHGAAEHSGRYARFAGFLNAHGYVVYANDHRGHGETRVRSGALGDAGPDGWNRMVEDLRELTALIRRAYPRAPIFLFGHSMGSFLAQDYVQRAGADLAGVVLCATNGVFAAPPEALARFEQAARADPLGPSQLFSARWESFNHPFEPGKPGFQWLSRDAEEVRKYVEDPYCGFPFSNELARDFMLGLRAIFSEEREARIPRTLPVLVIAGTRDPVGGNTKTIEPLIARYRARGMHRVQVKFYADARHELLNETNRDEVQRDVLAWLDGIVAPASQN